MTSWKYNNKTVRKPPKTAYGFVYKITHKPSGQYYIGMKLLYSKRTRPPLKGYKRKRRDLIESNWKTYWGSSKEFNAFVEREGTTPFVREILEWCPSKTACKYRELVHQINNDVLNDPLSFNGIIQVRLRRTK